MTKKGLDDKLYCMKLILQENNKYVVRLDKGEDVMGQVKNFCEYFDIEAGFFIGMGAFGEATLSYYNLDTKEYEDVDITERMEVAGLTGNIAMLEGEIMIHAHGVFSGADLGVRAGHIKRLVVSGTCEIYLHSFSEKIERAYDPETGLNLMK